jgi:hypothetical protein
LNYIRESFRIAIFLISYVATGVGFRATGVGFYSSGGKLEPDGSFTFSLLPCLTILGLGTLLFLRLLFDLGEASSESSPSFYLLEVFYLVIDIDIDF